MIFIKTSAGRFGRATWIVTVLFAAFAASAPIAAQDEIADPPLPTPNPLRLPPDEGEGGPGDIEAEDVAAIDAIDAIDFVFTDENGDPLPPVDFTLTAQLTVDGPVLPSGLHWRIFGTDLADDGTYPLVLEAEGGSITTPLEPGRYFLHVLYGWAGATTELIVTPDHDSQNVVLNAGGLRLNATIGEDRAIAAGDLRFEVYGIDPEFGEDILITDSARPGDILRLSAGTVNVISYYGEANAVVQAAIDVVAGELTDLTLYHEAAKVTLKLVGARGGEAMANTSWSVVSPGGEILFDSTGAFPTVVLAQGDYIAIAKHDDQIFEGNFAVVAGRDRDVEVLAVDPIDPAVPAEQGSGLP